MLKEEYSEIKIENIPENELKQKCQNETKIGFGRLFTDRMFYIECKWIIATTSHKKIRKSYI